LPSALPDVFVRAKSCQPAAAQPVVAIAHRFCHNPAFSLPG
jgi:hypothetical protein